MSSIAEASRTPALVSPLSSVSTSPTDLLGDMRPALGTAFAVGRPTDAAGAATVLATGASYLHGAAGTIARLDEGIRRRQLGLEQISDPTAAAKEREQLDLLQRLRDRIQLSMERVGDILAGKDRDDIGTPDDVGPAATARNDDHDRARRRRDEADLLDQRRQLLAPSITPAAAPGASPDRVAGAYAGTLGP